MKMLVRVDVIERQPRPRKSVELRANFSRQLSANVRQKEKPHPVPHHVVAKAAMLVEQRGNPRARRNRVAISQHQMQTDPQPREFASTRHRIGRGRRANHQARGRQHAVPVRLLDRQIHPGMQAEIVGSNDQAAWLSRHPKSP